MPNLEGATAIEGELGGINLEELKDFLSRRDLCNLLIAY